MPSRISGACNGCRSKKQKCSGDRSGCAQCAAAGIECTWPEQRKRGPAKGYIEALESRLYAAESLLLALLPRVDEPTLTEATNNQLRRNSRAGSETSGVGCEERRVSRSSPPTLNKKTGVDYWENFPIDSAMNVRRWQQDCEVHSYGHSLGRGSTQQHHHHHHHQPTSGSRQHREDDYRSSAAAAATMAGMRHGTTSPGTPGSGVMATASASRSISYEGSMSPGTSMSLAQNMSTTSAPHRQQQHMWYPQYGPMGASMINPPSMAMGPNMNFNEQWGAPGTTNAMDVDSMHAMSTTQPSRRGGRHSREPGPEQETGNARVGMYQENFPQDIFW